MEEALFSKTVGQKPVTLLKNGSTVSVFLEFFWFRVEQYIVLNYKATKKHLWSVDETFYVAEVV